MANIKSAKKRIKVTARQTKENRGQRSATKTAVKKALLAIEQNQENAEEYVKKASIVLDKAANKNIIHKNKAARKKSQLAKAYQSMQS